MCRSTRYGSEARKSSASWRTPSASRARIPPGERSSISWFPSTECMPFVRMTSTISFDMRYSYTASPAKRISSTTAPMSSTAVWRALTLQCASEAMPIFISVLARAQLGWHVRFAEQAGGATEHGEHAEHEEERREEQLPPEHDHQHGAALEDRVVDLVPQPADRPEERCSLRCVLVGPEELLAEFRELALAVGMLRDRGLELLVRLLAQLGGLGAALHRPSGRRHEGG